MRISDWSSDVCSSEVTVTEGNVIEENENGRGFVAVGGNGELQGVDQAFINATDEVKQPGTSVISELASIFQHFSGVVSLSLSGSFFSFSSSDDRRVGKEGVSTCRYWWSPDQ